MCESECPEEASRSCRSLGKYVWKGSSQTKGLCLAESPEGGLGAFLLQGLLETELHLSPQARVKELKFYGSTSFSV